MGSLLENEPYSLSLLQKGGRNFDDSGSRIIISIRETGNYTQVARNEPVYIYFEILGVERTALKTGPRQMCTRGHNHRPFIQADLERRSINRRGKLDGSAVASAV